MRARIALVLAFFMLISSELLSDLVWVKLPGPSGGSIYDIARDDNGTLYAIHGRESAMFYETESVAVIKGLYVSSNNGESWDYKYLGDLAGSFCRIFCFDGNKLLIPAEKGKILMSSDGGVNWETEQINNIRSVTNLFKTSDGIKFAAIGNYLYRKIENEPWMALKTMFDVEFHISGFVELSPGEIVISSCGVGKNSNRGAGLFRTTNYGKDWEKFAESEQLQAVYQIRLSDDGTVIASSPYGIFKITSAGALSMLFSREQFGIAELFRTTSLEISKNGSLLISVENTGFFRCSLNGSQLERISEGIFVKHFSSLLVIDEFNIFASSASGGMHRSIDGGSSWHPVNNGIQNMGTDYIFTTSADKIFTGVKGAGIFRTDISGAVWENVSLDNIVVDIIKMLETPTGALLAVTSQSVYRSADTGRTWAPVWRFNSSLDNPIIEKSPEGVLLISDYYGIAGVLKSDNDGLNWRYVHNGLKSLRIRGFAFKSENIVYAIDNLRIYISENGGESWRTLNYFADYKQGFIPIGCVFFKDRLFVCSNDELLALDELSNTLKKIVGVPEKSIFSMDVIDNCLFLRQPDRFLRSRDGAVNWNMILNNTGASVNSFSLINSGQILVGTDAGIFLSKLANDEIRFLKLKTEPSNEIIKYYRDSINIAVTVSDDNGGKLSDFKIIVFNGLTSKLDSMQTNDGKAVFTAFIHDGLNPINYSINFSARHSDFQNIENKTVEVKIQNYIKWTVEPDEEIFIRPGETIFLNAKVTNSLDTALSSANIWIYHLLDNTKMTLLSQTAADEQGSVKIEIPIGARHRFGRDSLLLMAYHEKISPSNTELFSKKVYFFVVNPASADKNFDVEISMQINPNPVAETGEFTIYSLFETEGELSIFDIYGKTVISEKTRVFYGSNRIGINANLLPSGTYLAVLKTINYIAKTMFVVTK